MTEHQVGNGSAVVGWEAARSCCLPNNPVAQNKLTEALVAQNHSTASLAARLPTAWLPPRKPITKFVINEGDFFQRRFLHPPALCLQKSG